MVVWKAMVAQLLMAATAQEAQEWYRRPGRRSSFVDDHAGNTGSTPSHHRCLRWEQWVLLCTCWHVGSAVRAARWHAWERSWCSRRSCRRSSLDRGAMIPFYVRWLVAMPRQKPCSTVWMPEMATFTRVAPLLEGAIMGVPSTFGSGCKPWPGLSDHMTAACWGRSSLEVSFQET